MNLIYRGKPLAISGDYANTLGRLRIQVSAAVSVPSENVRLLADGKLLSPTQDNTPLAQLLRPSQTVLVLATPPEAIKTLKQEKPDTSLRPLVPKAPKYVATPRKTPNTPKKYGFGTVSVLPDLPNADRARQILEQLASDRGFLAVMEKKRWYVGELREMPPEGRVGVDPVCVLGYNTNKGQQIHLRLRTDDMTGFRAMFSIRQVLAHELAHNEFSEHDADFKELMRWIEKTAARDNWRSLGNRLDSNWEAPEFNTVPSSWARAERRNEGNKLGSEHGPTRVSRLLQAYERNAARAQAGDGGSSMVEEDETERVARAEDEKVNERRTALEEVMCLGFSRELAALALRENGGDASRAADWLLSERVRRGTNGEMGEAEAETTRSVEKAVDSLRTCLSGNTLIRILDTLHLYLSNVLRHTGVERYCRINSENRAFQQRVGAYKDAVEVLLAAGFRLEGAFWRYSSLEVSRVWIAKSVVEERLLEEMMKT